MLPPEAPAVRTSGNGGHSPAPQSLPPELVAPEPARVGLGWSHPGVSEGRSLRTSPSTIPTRSPKARASRPRAVAPPPLPADLELLAIVVGRGRATATALTRARRLLDGGLAELARADVGELEGRVGITASCAATIVAAIELGRRSVGQRPERGRRLATGSDVWEHFRARLAAARSEEFWIVGLDVRHRVILDQCVARGSLTGVEVHPREVYRPLIRASAAAVIFCHNHPSGDPTPSRQDFELTARLKEVGALCGITVLDHVVVATDGYVSLAARGWL